ncbi:MAG: hypothetical protein QM773_16020 [Hyphomonadaceae bacterium]
MVRSAFLTGRVVAGCCLLVLAACATSKPVAPPPPSAATAPAPSANPKAMPDQATLALYRTWIGEARAKYPYPESEARMYAVMMCESEGRAAVVNPAGPYTGLFQYATQTWKGAWNTYRDDGILSARAQIFATALAWSLKMQSHWDCYKKTG